MSLKTLVAILAALLVIGSTVLLEVNAKRQDINPGDAKGGMPKCLADKAELQAAIDAGDTALQAQLEANAELQAQIAQLEAENAALEVEVESAVEESAKAVEKAATLQAQLDACQASN
jgi:chromosome segregation ATPase